MGKGIVSYEIIVSGHHSSGAVHQIERVLRILEAIRGVQSHLPTPKAHVLELNINAEGLVTVHADSLWFSQEVAVCR